jgi:hypothetical protein
MNKYPSIIIAAVVAVCVTSVFAQGTVVFNNGNGGLVLTYSPQVNSIIPMPKGGGQVQLYWAATGTPYTYWGYSSPSAWYAANPGWKLENPIGFTTPTAGKFTGGTFILSPLSAGGSIDYVVIGWTGIHQSLDSAMAGNGYVAVSSRFTSATGNPTTVPPGTAVPLADTFGGLTLQPIPEPSAFALATLGAATLLALHRRK